MSHNIHVYIGYLAACLTTFSFLPQAIKTIKSKCTKGISIVMYSMFTTGIFFWLLYGFLINDFIIILANLITFIFASIILFITFVNYIKAKRINGT
ncbi:MAG: SemiSWEET transporter [Silvanigrellaceae bacterium]|jgi:MtN3 and saliva related transmembrane protein|nr:SemiSWEET transporter [Silvanigrellaceae bacterium]